MSYKAISSTKRLQNIND